ncbi:MAG: CDP-alcohol phosphatidyltransferase family protein [Clostridia bacterium]|nr:CDP-alcohol phosphatidyltransferase family protein [Clostridia bacterium]
MKLKYIPNILSVIRILLVFVFIYLFFVPENIVAAIIVFLIAGLTDVIDGILARKNNWITNLGKILDPVADKFMQFTVLISFSIKGLLPWWFSLPFFLKDITTLILGAIVIKRRSVAIVSRWYGKLAVCLFYATVVLSVILKDILAENIAASIALYIPAIVCAIASFIAYVKHYAYLKHEEIVKGNFRNIRKEL